MADLSWQQALASETDPAKKEWMALERRYRLQLVSKHDVTQDKLVRLFVSLSDPELPMRLKGEVELQMTLPGKYPEEAPRVDFDQWISRLSDQQVAALNAAVNARAQQLCGSFSLRRLLTWIDNNFWRIILPFEQSGDDEEEMESSVVHVQQEEPVAPAEERSSAEKKKPKRRRGQRPCRFFARGSCRDGDTCKFSHEKKINKTVEGGSDVEDADTTTVVREADPANTPEKDPTPEQAAVSKLKKKTRARRCRFFAQNKCRDGDKCKFSHELKPSSKCKKLGPEVSPRAVVVQIGTVPANGIQDNGNGQPTTSEAAQLVVTAPSEEPKADNSEWSEAQQRALDVALQKYPASMDKQERWTSIASDVEGRSLNECIDRFKLLCDLVRRGVDPTTMINSRTEEAEEEVPIESEDHASNVKITPPDERVVVETEPEVKGTQMSRWDKQKYRGQNKTESKKFKRVGAEAKRRRDNGNANVDQHTIMVHFTLAGRVNSEEYAICDRLLDILAATLPDCKATKLPSKADRCFNLPTSSNLVISDVAIWTDTGRLLCSDVDAFSTFVGRNYGIQLDLTEAEVLLYIKANVEELRQLEQKAG
ncbi:hypothetical protein PHYBOEH_006398 [Phytophthora boehmeriae]|uniref:Uncharacterized protein n=1 Tax=Phytophthora boehmeriae TaxID=109152 RepID=A0A8T1X3U9_9STRA|nr:hypothetical protein PHYBOEH_006398 [Phytophthora boehmeriae]